MGHSLGEVSGTDLPSDFNNIATGSAGSYAVEWSPAGPDASSIGRAAADEPALDFIDNWQSTHKGSSTIDVD